MCSGQQTIAATPVGRREPNGSPVVPRESERVRLARVALTAALGVPGGARADRGPGASPRRAGPGGGHGRGRAHRDRRAEDQRPFRRARPAGNIVVTLLRPFARLVGVALMLGLALAGA